MKSVRELTIQLPITFEIEKGQQETKDNPGYPDSIIDLDFTAKDAFKAVFSAIYKDIESIEAELLEKAAEDKKEALSENVVNDFEGGLKI